jgi:hypothetical protein
MSRPGRLRAASSPHLGDVGGSRPRPHRLPAPAVVASSHTAHRPTARCAFSACLLFKDPSSSTFGLETSGTERYPVRHLSGIAIADQVAEGWACHSRAGANCRGGSKWNPSLPHDAGLPMGDRCSRTNSPATATCHDAYPFITRGAEQAFKIKDGTCALGTLWLRGRRPRASSVVVT